ncbi:hypothetical protein RRG08_043164, partial [Elysia crispata]
SSYADLPYLASWDTVFKPADVLSIATWDVTMGTSLSKKADKLSRLVNKAQVLFTISVGSVYTEEHPERWALLLIFTPTRLIELADVKAFRRVISTGLRPELL